MVERRFPKPDVEGSSPSGRVKGASNITIATDYFVNNFTILLNKFYQFIVCFLLTVKKRCTNPWKGFFSIDGGLTVNRI